MLKRIIQTAFLCFGVLLLFITCEKDSDTTPEDTGSYTDGEITIRTGNHEDVADYEWDSSKEINISLKDNAIVIDSTGATDNGSKVTITNAGTYNITGSLTNGQIIVNTSSEETVRLILNEVNIACSSSAPINIQKAEKVILVLPENKSNTLTDGSTYVYDDATEMEPNAAVFSKSDLTVYGNGNLTIKANFNDGIASKDGVIIHSGNINITAKDDGIRGKDYLIVHNGDITIKVEVMDLLPIMRTMFR